jgi:hypothetical protein
MLCLFTHHNDGARCTSDSCVLLWLFWRLSIIFNITITIRPGLKILCMKFMRTVDNVHIVSIPFMTGLETDKNLTVYTITVLFLILQDDAIDKQQTL